MTAPTYRQCSKYFHQYIDHLAVAYNELMQPFFASGTFFSKGLLLDRYCLHTRVAILREGENTANAFNYIFLAPSCASLFTHTHLPSSIKFSIVSVMFQRRIPSKDRKGDYPSVFTYPSQLLPHVQFVPLFSEAVYLSIVYLKNSSSSPFRLLSTGLNAIMRLPTVASFSAIP